MESIDSPHAETILNSLNAQKKKTFAQFFGDIGEDAMDMLRKLLTFNPNHRLTVEEALKHKYVAQFSAPEEEIGCDHVIEIPLNDFTKLTTKEYREAIYSHIAKKKRERRRKIQERYLIQTGLVTEPSKEKFDKTEKFDNKAQQPQQIPVKFEKPSQNVSSNNMSNVSQSQTLMVTKSQSHTQSPTHSRSQAASLAGVTNGVKVRASRGIERSQSHYSNGSLHVSSAQLPPEDKSPSPMLLPDKGKQQQIRTNSRARHAYIGKTEGDVMQDEKPLSGGGSKQQLSMSPQRKNTSIGDSRKTYYLGGSHVNVKNLLRSTGMNASKVLSQSGNSFILKKK